MASALQPLGKRQLLHQQVQDELKRFIVENRLRPGEPLPAEMELARQLGVGRNTVREAVKSLEALGILNVRAGAGVSVRDSSLDVLNGLTHAMLVDFRLYTDVREVRQYLEQSLIEPVIERATSEQIEELRRILSDWRSIARQGTYSVDHDRDFHAAFWQNLNNRFLTKILEIFWETQVRMLESGVVSGPANPLDHQASHRAILEALEARDADRLRGVLADHYLDILKRLERSQKSRRRTHRGVERTLIGKPALPRLALVPALRRRPVTRATRKRKPTA